jgi:hypothetical protein
VDLVGGHDLLLRVAHVPEPLAALDVDDERAFLRRGREGGEGGDREREEPDEDGRGDGDAAAEDERPGPERIARLGPAQRPPAPPRYREEDEKRDDCEDDRRDGEEDPPDLFDLLRSLACRVENGRAGQEEGHEGAHRSGGSPRETIVIRCIPSGRRPETGSLRAGEVI